MYVQEHTYIFVCVLKAWFLKLQMSPLVSFQYIWFFTDEMDMDEKVCATTKTSERKPFSYFKGILWLLGK